MQPFFHLDHGFGMKMNKNKAFQFK